MAKLNIQKLKASELELKEKVVNIRRVTKVTKGGRTFTFSATVVVGNGNGIVGEGLGKAREVQEAIQKAIDDAKKNLVSRDYLDKEFKQGLVERLKQRLELFQAADDGAGGQLHFAAAQFGDDPMQRLKELVLVLQDQHPQRDADGAFENDFVRSRRREDGGLTRTLADATIAVPMINATMSTHIDFENVAILGARDFLVRFAAIGTTPLVLGQGTGFVGGGQMIVIASAMSWAASLLTTCTRGALRTGLTLRLGRGGSFGFASEQTPLPLADFALELSHLLCQSGFPLDGTLMLSAPIVSLLAEVDDLQA